MSMIEIAFAVLIAGLAIGPIFGLLVSTNKEASSAIYEVTAAHYANEIAEQLLTFDALPGFQVLSVNAGVGVKELLESANLKLGDKSIQTPLKIPLASLDVFLLVSPLSEVFQERSIEVSRVETPADMFLPGEFYRVVVRLGWTSPGEGTATGQSRHSHETVIFVRKAP